MRRKKLIWQLFPPFLFITFISLLATTVYVTKFWRQLYLEQLTANLLKQTRLAEPQLHPLLVDKNFSQIDKLTKFLGKQTDIRFSVFLPDGKVVGDPLMIPEKWTITVTGRNFKKPSKEKPASPPDAATP